MIDTLAVSRNCPYLSIKHMVLHTNYTFVVVCCRTCIVCIGRGIAHTANTGVTVV